MAEKAGGKALVRYIARHRILHDGVEYHEGDEFSSADEGVIASLRKGKAIALPMELETPESVAEREARLRAENERLQAELEQLRSSAAVQAPKKAEK